MHPYFQISSDLFIPSYNIFFLIAIYTGIVIFYLEAKRREWDIENLMFALSGCFLGAMMGATSFNIILFGKDSTLEKLTEVDISGMSVLGGILGGFIGVEVFKKIAGHKESTGDVFALAIPIGHAIGRIGCLLSGCCFGIPTNLPWSISYPKDSIPHIVHQHRGLIDDSVYSSLPVHPIPIYEIVFNIILFVILLKLRDYFKVSGALFRFYILAYCFFRFFEEFLRGDTGVAIFLGLKLIQINLLVSIGLIAYWFARNEFNRLKI